MARSLILFFFEDCTWGDKTEKEKLMEQNKWLSRQNMKI
jgi:hypothetical protein